MLKWKQPLWKLPISIKDAISNLDFPSTDVALAANDIDSQNAVVAYRGKSNIRVRDQKHDWLGDIGGPQLPPILPSSTFHINPATVAKDAVSAPLVAMNGKNEVIAVWAQSPPNSPIAGRRLIFSYRA